MSEYYGHSNDQISIGEMAEKFHISPRTLRLYHDMGLLIPQSVGNSNNYRYYSVSQFQRLEMILQMKSVGLSLKQIKTILDTRNLSVFEALLSEQIDKLSEQISTISSTRDTLIKQLNSCAHLRHLPALNAPFIEFIPKRLAFAFDIEPYDLRVPQEGISPWAQALDNIKDTLLEHDMPIFLLNQACCAITREDLMNRRYRCSSALLLTDDSLTAAIPRQVIPSGTYACLYCNYIAMDSRSESEGLDKLLQFIDENHYQIIGPYLGEIAAKMSVFDFNNNTILVKLQIPVRISE